MKPKKRRSAGRPALPNEERKVNFTVRMTPASRAQMQQAATAKERSLGEEIETRLVASLKDDVRFDDDAVWEEATRLAKIEVDKAQARVAARCAELGIPKEFAPQLELTWHHRGYQNSLEKRRNELRVMARTRIEALEKRALTEIALASVEAQTELARAGLTSQVALAFIDKLPSIQSLMPALSFEAVAGKAEPPIAEQLISPGALRQPRYRERHRNASVTSRNGGQGIITKGEN